MVLIILKLEQRNDTSGYDDFSMPREFNRESSTGFLIARITIQMASTWNVISTVDLRGSNPSTATGGASGVSTTFPDNTFAVFDETDPTKILAFDVGANVTTGNTRTLTVPDASETMVLEDTSLTGNIEFANYKAIAMVCDNGATLPSAGITAGQWFLHTPTGRNILYQYDGSNWISINLSR